MSKDGPRTEIIKIVSDRDAKYFVIVLLQE